MDTYEKKYNEALERANAAIDIAADKDLVGGVVRTIFPELRESEDERIIKKLQDYVKNRNWSLNGPTQAEVLAWLEKQKINTEGDFGRGYDCGYQAGYAVAMNEMKPKVATATLDSCEESLHISEPCKENADSFTDEDEKLRKLVIYRIRTATEMTEGLRELLLDYLEKQKDFAANEYWRGFGAGRDEVIANPDAFNLQEKQKEQKKDNPLEDFSKGYNAGYYHGRTDNEQKPVEWSEEDEKMLNEVLDRVTYAFYDQGNEGEIEDDPAFLWLHRLRPSWKPSEEQMEALNFAITYFMHETTYKNPTELRELYENLKRL